jgi:hypothetical protein
MRVKGKRKKKEKKGSNSIDEEGWKYIYFFMMITRGVKTRPSVFFSVRPFHVVVFSPFFFSPYFLLLLYTFSSSSSSWG